MKVNIHYRGGLVADVSRAPQGEVYCLGHNIEPCGVLDVLNSAATVMARTLQQRGVDIRDLEKERDALSALQLRPAEDPADWRRAAKILRELVYRMGERLCSSGEDVDVEIEKLRFN